MASESGAVLHGPRVTLRPWRDDDREPFAALNADPLVMRYFRCPLDTLQSDAMLLRMRVAMATHGFGWWALDVPLLGFAGFVGLSRVPFEAPFSALADPAIEVGWRLRTDAWGQGYATRRTSGRRQASGFRCSRHAFAPETSFPVTPETP